MISTRPGATPATPPSSRPRPPSGFSRKYAPACAERRPAISLIGASSGKARFSVSTVSYATHAAPLSARACVSSSFAARWRYVKRTWPSCRSEYSSGSGSLTLSRSSASSQTSCPGASEAPTAEYASSSNELPPPAPASTSTSCPSRTSSRAPAGVSATRYSSALISFTTPTFIAAKTLALRTSHELWKNRHASGTKRHRHARPARIRSPWGGGRANRSTGRHRFGGGQPLDELGANELPRRGPGGVGSREELRVVVGAPAHVRERQVFARLAPAHPVLRDDGLAADERQHRLCVMRNAAVARPLVGGRGTHGNHRHSAERERRVGSFRGGKPAVSEPRTRSDDPGPDRARRDVVLSLRPGERRCGRDALDIGVEAGRDRRGPGNEPTLAQHAHGVRERDRQRSTRELHVGNAQAPERRAGRRDLAVQRAADDRQPAQLGLELDRFLDVQPRMLERRVREYHHVRPLLRLKLEPARQVRVEHVEAARAELELTRLDVDEHLVLQLDRPGERGIRHAGDPVDLEPDEPVMTLDDRRDPPAAQAKRHRPPPRRGRASSRPSRAGRRPQSARPACGCRSSRSRG